MTGGRPTPCAVHRTFLLWLFIAASSLYLFTAGSNFTGGDSYSELHVTESLVTHAWFDVPVLKPGQLCAGWGCRGADGRYYASHAIGYSLFLVPFYLTARAAISFLHIPHCETWVRCVPIHLISWTSCLLSAGAVTLLALFATDLGYGVLPSALVALLYGFASPAWPYARFGFDVTLAGLLLLAAIRAAYLALREAPASSQATRQWLVSGLWGALAVLVRVPSLAALAPLAFFALWHGRRLSRGAGVRSMLVFALPFLPVLAFTFWYNAVRFGGVLDDGHRLIAANHLSATPWEGVLGTFISPGKGIVWYCPLILVAAALIPSYYRARPVATSLLLSVSLCSLLPYVLLNDWYGGAAWGPRYTLPVLAILFLPLLQWFAHPGARTAQIGFYLCIVLSLVIQAAGLLVGYADRLSLAARRGYAGAVYWDPRHAPLLDHLGTLITYLRQPAALESPVPISQTFDIWWLNLWRIDGVEPDLSMLGGLVLGIAALVSALKLFRVLRSVEAHQA